MRDDDVLLSWQPAPGHGEEVLYALDGPLGRVRLNRPRAINALDRASIDSLHQQLQAWADEDQVVAVVLDGAGERGLCAGGDVRALREAILEGREQEAVDYWEAEYAVDALVASYPKPYVAWMDGIVMGGGVGVSAHGSVRLVTENTQLAMPETIIGFFPDVAGLHPLSRAPGETGTHVALTGAPVGGADAVLLGMADALVPSASKGDVLAALRADPTLDAAGLASVVGGTGHTEGSSRPAPTPTEHPSRPDPTSWLEQQRDWIDACYVGEDAAAILERLRERPEPEAQEAADLVAARSPHSVAVALEALRRAATMSVEQVLAQDLRLGPVFASHPDFAEGVRAQLVDKDRRPRWQHESVADVPREEVLAAFGDRA
ncbi:3-hydroxyisobutyryl-CoA hydrolase [Serinicoccus hydrothermalis]|uniref:3-hydroxyisobutyryl-CoA hydrolase n=1 Tax=Serinicoccus hydrothermalis TaxID=1758689 RepID=A0A1B1NCI1_9MICO|nr:enoyl-CoA hydratase/isomerase family protein [Serinicoccus hydrothermalis]ANS79075.1 3-hydroxyisobutyryl-CoA hydrolase [Serinicoccus hydrothermalis]